MKRVLLERFGTGDEGTFGRMTIVAETGEPLYSCVSLEPPWRNNTPKISCVPPGDYFFRWRTDSPKHGEVYEEWDDPSTEVREDVVGRERIQLHAANLAGDEERGFVRQLDGCIAPGLTTCHFIAGLKPAGHKSQRGVSASRTALAQMEAYLKRETFLMVIRWAEGVEPT